MARGYGISGPFNNLSEIVWICHIFKQKLIDSDVSVGSYINDKAYLLSLTFPWQTEERYQSEH